MAKIEMGLGFKVLVVSSIVLILVAGSMYIGSRLQKTSQMKSDIQILNSDSKIAEEIRVETKHVVDEVEIKIEKFEKPIVDSNCYMSDEFLQLLQSSKSDSEQRGDKTGIIYRVTSP